MIERVSVLGGGSWGTTLAHLLAARGHETTLWLRREELAAEINEQHRNSRHLGDLPLSPGLRATTDLEEAVRGVPNIVMAIPSHGFRAVLTHAADYLQGDQVVLSATKGFEESTGLRMTEVLRDESCVRKVGAISGPNLAREIVAGQPAATVVASRYEEVIQRGARLLHGPGFRVYGNRDVVGCEVGGALKNIVAIASGVSHGLGFGANTKSLLMTRGLAEIARFGTLMGAEAETFAGLAGMGDLIVTCSSELSRNFRVGLGLASGKSVDEVLGGMVEVAEGVRTTRVALVIAERLGASLPIAEGVARLLYDGASTKEVLVELMTRRAKFERTEGPGYADSEIPLEDSEL